MQRAGGGSIINISSIDGIGSKNALVAYSSSKGAVRAMTKTGALELGQYGIRVNSVHPGGVWTPGAALGDKLIEHPELANDPKIAADLLASFIKSRELPIKSALLDNDLRTARRLVNGGSHGLERFTDAYAAGERLLPDELA